MVKPDRLSFVLAMILIGLLAIITAVGMHRESDHAALCPAGTFYSERFDACIAGVRPWEEK